MPIAADTYVHIRSPTPQFSHYLIVILSWGNKPGDNFPDQMNKPEGPDEGGEDQLSKQMGQIQLQAPKSAPGINDNIDVGPPAFQPGVPWKGYQKRDNLDPDKNPDLTPAMLAEMQKEQQNQKNQGVST